MSELNIWFAVGTRSRHDWDVEVCLYYLKKMCLGFKYWTVLVTRKWATISTCTCVYIYISTCLSKLGDIFLHQKTKYNIHIGYRHTIYIIHMSVKHSSYWTSIKVTLNTSIVYYYAPSCTTRRLNDNRLASSLDTILFNTLRLVSLCRFSLLRTYRSLGLRSFIQPPTTTA